MGLKHSPCFGPLYDDKLCKECIIKEECRRKMLRKDFSQMTIEEVKKFSNCFGEMFSESSALCNKCLKRKECKVVFEYLKGGGKMDEKIAEVKVDNILGKPIGASNEKVEKEPAADETKGAVKTGGEKEKKVEMKVSPAKDQKKSVETLNVHQRRYLETGNPYPDTDGAKVARERFAKSKNPWSLKGKAGKLFEELKRKKVFTEDDVAEHRAILREGLVCGFIKGTDTDGEYKIA